MRFYKIKCSLFFLTIQSKHFKYQIISSLGSTGGFVSASLQIEPLCLNMKGNRLLSRH